MYLIVGLGNPGSKYKDTRHNIGVRFIEYLHTRWDFETLLHDAKNKAWHSKRDHVALATLDTPMNASGEAVMLLKKHFKIPSQHLWLVHDEIDLTLGTFKLAKDRGAAGHHGVESVINTIKTKNFNRLRLGIQPEFGKPALVDTFVLGKFSKDEQKIIERVFEEASEEFKTALKLK